jgi:hypothetical protein
MTSKPKKEEPFSEMDFDEALKRLAQTDKHELQEALSHDMISRAARTQKRVEEARKDIQRGARTRPKKERFRL